MNDNDFKKIRQVIQEELQPIKKTQNEHSEKLDALTSDMSDVQLKSSSTYDLVKAIHEHDQRDIAEIKKHLGLAHTSSPFKS